MNKVLISGRLTKDVELRYSNDTAVARFTVAVNRNKEETDFIPCVAFGKSAETIDKYCMKGSRIVVDGRIQTGSFVKKDGTKVYTTDVIVERQEIIDFLKSEKKSESKSDRNDDGFVEVNDSIGLPWN